ncbi:MAG: tRNA (adenosine(37)-N6)-threonylcarbamoyltransferase complex transferase subunit TsaD [Ruminococcaceae bacterium]|nr:tRNA (adenosine(37)-N6)-threonylcarbamoyltransferase complex transferase subunit TsaD [Oscillospiraceae bacterium]
MKILAIESSCDETSAAVVEDGRKILSNEVLSQIDIHKRYGGVVPEIASRAHIEAISPLVKTALETANVTLDDIDAVACTNRPGLIGALLVGVNFAKSLAYSLSKPLIPVNHIMGHVAANYLVHENLKPPFLALVISGGHTSVLGMDSFASYKTIARTRDDAIGEAFDKVARVMGLEYPGGKEMDRLAASGNPKAYTFPQVHVKDAPYDFSFSGLKTAVINTLHNSEQKGIEVVREDIAASFTANVVETLIDRLDKILADYDYKSLAVAGGVSANSHIRGALEKYCAKKGIGLYLPPISLCGDNAAMIGAQAFYDYQDGITADISLNAFATL